MKKIITTGLMLVGTLLTFAQKNASLSPTQDVTCEKASTVDEQSKQGIPMSPQALFTVQFNYNAQDSSGKTGMAGVVYTGSEFWVSKWSNDTVFTFSPGGAYTGSFTIPTVTGIRGFTYDGTNVYAGVNSTSIKIINPTTKTLSGTITVANGTAVRFITYDSTANAGAGGFWIGNFSTNISQISMTGATLQTITAATHGLTGMYGAAIDHWTTGGPYLWVFDQGGTSQARIVRLQLPGGTNTGVVHDVMTDVGVNLTSGLAGGIFITKGLNPTTRTIVGLVQGTPDNLLFGYELNNFTLPSEDAALDSLNASSPYVMLPLNHFTTPLTWTGLISNQGINTLTSTSFVVNVKQGVTNVYNNVTNISNLTNFSTINQTTSAGLSAAGTGTFNVTAFAKVNSPQTDANNANDTIKYSYMITDTVFARETGNTSGSLGIGNGTGGTLGQKFTLSVNDQIRSATFRLNGPTAGDSVKVDLYSFTNQPGTILASTPYYKIMPADTDGVTLTLPFIGGPYSASAGTYFLGLVEHMANVTLATSTSNFRPNSMWTLFGGNPWTAIENLGFERTFYLRMNVAALVGINDAEASNSNLQVYPNPANEQLNLVIENNSSNATYLSITNTLGETLISKALNGKGTVNETISVKALPSGIYFIQVKQGEQNSVKRIVVTH